ncbi:hypothetical protein COCCADRAFT_25895 [Bipolaris zeicola 26-R-13]|uniref:Uncharacterized protein n=1 Tax=Cochliobolus carbonum (strain 26-R-13) TaxID=930089 RepID=W6YR18_COCC2|nr:uncharacterized protein COCCADRAFT_25895 [Bipolaris zeicola 26-R-13]EUC33926.1 hypothetical protein COCCADRAFT_25895 [Bipolaris zeicola 26-R-13]
MPTYLSKLIAVLTITIYITPAIAVNCGYYCGDPDHPDDFHSEFTVTCCGGKKANLAKSGECSLPPGAARDRFASCCEGYKAAKREICYGKTPEGPHQCGRDELSIEYQ